jgi:hypothetical protein
MAVMQEHDNVQRLRGALDAFSRGDMTAYRAGFNCPCGLPTPPRASRHGHRATGSQPYTRPEADRRSPELWTVGSGSRSSPGRESADCIAGKIQAFPVV